MLLTNKSHSKKIRIEFRFKNKQASKMMLLSFQNLAKFPLYLHCRVTQHVVLTCNQKIFTFLPTN